MMRKLLMLWLAAPLMALAQPSIPIERMLESLASTETLSADFSQTTAGKASRARASSGSFWISKPGMLRWEIKKPYPQLQILNGREFWVYDRDLAQASVRSVQAANITGLASLLLNTNNLSREELLTRYDFSEAGSQDGILWIRVVPKKPEPGITSLKVALDKDSMISKFEIQDALGQVTRIELTDVLKNTFIDPSQFEFRPPPGVAVIRSP